MLALLLVIAGSVTAYIGTQTGNIGAALAGAALVVVTVYVTVKRRRARGYWACWNGHTNPVGSTRCRIVSCDAH
jgi:LPXTG-motif cell wall-anchored protein